MDEHLNDVALMRWPRKGPFLPAMTEAGGLVVQDRRAVAITQFSAGILRQTLERGDFLPGIAAILAAMQVDRLGPGIDDAIVSRIDGDRADVPVQDFAPVPCGIIGSVQAVAGHSHEDAFRAPETGCLGIDDGARKGLGYQLAGAVPQAEHQHALVRSGVDTDSISHGTTSCGTNGTWK